MKDTKEKDNTEEPVIKATPIEKIKESFNQGLVEGRRSLLKKLLQVKGVEPREIQKLYSAGLMEPEILKDITLTDLVKSTGIGMGLARSIKEVILRKESELPVEYEKLEVNKIKKETNDILLNIEKVRKEIELLNREDTLLQAGLKSGIEKRNKLQNSLEELKEKEKKCYFNEKRNQDEVMFIIKEQNGLKLEVDKLAKNLEKSESELDNIKRDFLFTKGECNYILEKLNYLMAKLDTSMKIKNVSQNKLKSFVNELSHLHDALMDTYKKTSLEYYANK